MKIIQNVKFSLTIFNFIVILFIVVAPLAQLVEHPTLNRQVPGSNPWWRTKKTLLPQVIAGFCFYTVIA